MLLFDRVNPSLIPTDGTPTMKTLVLRLFAFVSLMLPLFAQGATPAQFEAWKAGFPASVSDSPQLQRMEAGYQLLVSKITPATSRKSLALLRSKMIGDQERTNHILHPTRPTPTITPAMRADAEEFSRWLNGKFAPFLAAAPQ